MVVKSFGPLLVTRGFRLTLWLCVNKNLFLNFFRQKLSTSYFCAHWSLHCFPGGLGQRVVPKGLKYVKAFLLLIAELLSAQR